MIQEDDRSPKHSTVTRHERAVLALLQYPSVPKAAEALGIHPATLWRWLKNPALQKKLNEARRQQFSQNVGRLQQGCNAATSALFRIMTDEHCAAGSRVRAAESILRLPKRVWIGRTFCYGSRIWSACRRKRTSGLRDDHGSNANRIMGRSAEFERPIASFCK